MDRRRFLKHATAGGAALGFGPGFWHAAFAAPAEPGPGPYGPIGPSNLSDVLLPDGFTARVIAVGGVPVGALHGGDIPFVWPALPDGAACYPTDDGGWILACNSEVPRDEVLRTALGLPIDVTTGGASSSVMVAVWVGMVVPLVAVAWPSSSSTTVSSVSSMVSATMVMTEVAVVLPAEMDSGLPVTL